MRLKGRTALVTGAAAGMGRAICKLFAAEGSRVAVNYRSSEREAESLVAEIEAGGGEAFAFQADVADEAQVRAMMSAVGRAWSRLDILVNNAGWSKVTPHADLDALTDEIWDRTLDTNLRGAFYCVRQALPLLRESDAPAIVNNASAAAWHAAGSSLVYGASKAALVNLTKGLARALAPAIRVNAVAPGLVETNFADWPHDTFEKGREITPLQRLATVDDVAQAVLFLASATSSITAETIVIDGGRTRLGVGAR